MNLSAHTIISDPAWLPHTFNQSGDQLDFVRLTTAEREALPFLAEEYVGNHFPHRVLHFSDVAALSPLDGLAPIHFIFHTAFCCSTLLARALALPGVASDLREPDILMNLANRLLRDPNQGNLDRLDIALQLLARPMEGSNPIIVKPSNFTNNLAGAILKLRPSSSALLLYSDLDAFLRSVAKKGMWGRLWVRRLFLQHSAWNDLKLGFTQRDIFQLSDLQIAGLCWLMQISHFQKLIGHHGRERVIALNSSVMLAEREMALKEASRHFALGYDDSDIGRMAKGPAFSKDSKTLRPFSKRASQAEDKATSSAHRDEIEMVVTWIGKLQEKGEIALLA